MLERGKWIVIAITVFLSVLFFWQATKLTFDYNFENFFPSNDPDLIAFKKYKSSFETDNDYLLLGIENNVGIFNSSFLEKIKILSDSIAQDSLVKQVLSPTNIKYPVIGDFGAMQIPFLHYNNADKYSEDSIRIYNSPELIGTFFSKDAKSLSLLIKTIEAPSKVKSDIILERLEKIIGSMHFDNYHLSGKVKAQKVYISTMQDELKLFVGASALLVILFLFISFRSFSAIVLPLLVVVLSLVWILGIVQFFGKKIDLIMTILPTILFVVGMSDIVHIYSKYLDELRNGSAKSAAIKKSIKEIGFATFLTSITTAIGFLTLITTNILPVRDFGFFMALGVFIAFIISVTFYPSLLLLLPKPPIGNYPINQKDIGTFLPKLLRFIFKRQKLIISLFCFVLLLSIIGIKNVKVNNLLLEDLGNDHPLKKDFAFFETHYSGVRPFELSISTGKSSSTDLLDFDLMVKMNELNEYLENEYEVGFLQSPVSAVKLLNKAFHGGLQKYYTLPDNKEEYERISIYIKKNKNRKELKSVLSTDFKTCRFSGKMADLGSHVVGIKNDSLEKYILKNLNETSIEVNLTGTAHLIDKNNKNLAINMLQGLLIAFIAIGFVVGFMFKSFKMILIALIINVLPLIIIAGIMGFTGIDLKISTSIIFTIAFGIAVDDTIHFLSKLKYELDSGRSVLYSIKRTFLSTGKAIVLTTLILCGGFLALIFSDFQSTFYIGFLISITLFLALISDLFLLPVLILLFYREK